ncbi:hypothetical protein SDJN02_14939, partial [Cucurbita argyrosperma subsp. argyrosperma]
MATMVLAMVSAHSLGTFALGLKHAPEYGCNVYPQPLRGSPSRGQQFGGYSALVALVARSIRHKVLNEACYAFLHGKMPNQGCIIVSIQACI